MSKRKMLLEPAYLKIKDSLMAKQVLLPAMIIAFSQPVSAESEHILYAAGTSNLVIENVVQDVVITVSGKSRIKAQGIQGSSVKIRQEDDTLYITGSHNNASTNEGLNVTLIAVNGEAHFSTSMSSSDSTDDQLEPIQLSIPVNTNVVVNQPKGSLQIHGPMKSLSYHGDGKVTTDAVDDLKLELSGNARVRTSFVGGDLKIKSAGNSKVKINDGQIKSANLTFKGNSKFRFPGKVNHLLLAAKGNSRLAIGSVSYIETMSVNGNAKVELIDDGETLSRSAQ